VDIHRVTQWMSTVTVSVGSAWNSCHVHETGDWPPSMENVQSVSRVCGVGPADSTGKSEVTYCPGGTRPAGSASWWRRWKPREIGLIRGRLRRRDQEVDVESQD